MKQKDIVLIIVVAFLAGVISLVVANVTLGSPSNRKQKVEVVHPIKADFTEPDKRYFNANSVNPTQLIQIGESDNPTPFNTN